MSVWRIGEWVGRCNVVCNDNLVVLHLIVCAYNNVVVCIIVGPVRDIFYFVERVAHKVMFVKHQTNENYFSTQMFFPLL